MANRNRPSARSIGVAALLGCLVVGAFAADWCTVDEGAKSMENSLLRVRYGSSPSYWGNGIIEFRNKTWNEDYAVTFDCFGCAAATYDRSGPSTYAVSQETDDMVEVHVRFTDCVSIDKKDRLFVGLPILEIEYSSHQTMWWEDFFDATDTAAVLSIYGVAEDITKADYIGSLCGPIGSDFCPYCDWYTQGSCFLERAGSSPQECSYNGYLIQGVHSVSTGRGAGMVVPMSIGIDGWKPWWYDAVYNFEWFGAPDSFKRWIYTYENGRAGMEARGTEIADCAASGQSLSECLGSTASGGGPNVVRGKGMTALAEFRTDVSNGVLRIDAPRAAPLTVTVHDALGRAVRPAGSPAASDHARSFLLGGPGMYVVRVVTGERTVCQKVCVLP
jgi:hypothetical protein